MLDTLLNKLEQKQLLRPLDRQFACWLNRQLPESQPVQLLLAALVSFRLGEGHVCIDLDNLKALTEAWPLEMQEEAQPYFQQIEYLCDQKIIGNGDCLTPLVIDRGKLYLYRYWQYECQVAAKLLGAHHSADTPLDAVLLKGQLDKYFQSTESIDWQRVAAAIAVNQKISVISGGPGTGKTTTVTKLLAIYVEHQLSKGRRPLIQLAAPTGKAAARLSESIALAKDKLQIDPLVAELIPDQGCTLHRLLGTKIHSRQFIHNEDNPLLLDLLVIDEASMIDLPMMANVINALSSQTRLILIGDRDQLASVEAGSVLGDICAVPSIAEYSEEQSNLLAKTCGFTYENNSSYPFSDHLAFLQKSYRFSADSGIGALATLCNRGDIAGLEKLLSQENEDLDFYPMQESFESLLTEVLQGYDGYFQQIKDQDISPAKLLASFNQFQVLCALRVGAYGVVKLNEEIENYLQRNIKIEDRQRWYVGRPIMITKNDSQMQLYNGDIGITCYDSNGHLKVWFEQGGELRAILPSRLPQHETVFAMTVHKSQGSEFEHILLVVTERSNVINRELIYTAITRAKIRFSCYGKLSIIKQSILNKTVRSSGLAQRIWSF